MRPTHEATTPETLGALVGQLANPTADDAAVELLPPVGDALEQVTAFDRRS